MKTIKLLLTTIAVLLGSVMANAYDFEVDGIRYDITSFTDLTVKASSLSETFVGDLVIPSNVQFNGKELDVKEIGDDFAASNEAILSLTINTGVDSIGDRAFKNCINLTRINIAQTVTKIGAECFYACTALDAFNNNGVINIGSKSFAECKNLKEVSIESLVSLGEGAFLNCKKLSVCHLPNITSIAKATFQYCQALEEYNIPNSVKSIGESAFEGCAAISSIVIPDNVLELGYGAFNYCTSLTFISIGSGLTYLPWVFEESTNLSDIRIEDATTTLTFGFTGEQKESWDDDYDNKDVIDYTPYPAMFIGFNLKNIYIGRNITTEKFCYFRREYSSNTRYGYYIPNPPFSESSIESLTIGFFVSDYQMSASTIDADFKQGIWAGAFQNCTNLESVILYSTATSIPENMFSGCSKISSLEIPNAVKEIGVNAFKYCTELKEITLGSKLETIGANALDSCNSLREINLKSPIPPTYKTGFSSASYINTQINVPTDAFSIYQEAEPWKNFWNLSKKNELISFFEVDGIKYSAIENKNVEIIGNRISQPRELYINNKVEYYGNTYDVVAISNGAFQNCSYLSSVHIEKGIKKIGAATFKNCSSLKNIILPDSISTIPDECFYGCEILNSINIPQNVTSIGAHAFYKCKKIKKLTIPSSVSEVGAYALVYCSNLKELIFEDGNVPLLLSHKGEYESESGYIDANGIKIYIDYYNSYFSNIPIEVLYIGRNLSNESRYSISEKKWDSYYYFNYYVVDSYDAPFNNLSKLKELTIGENVDILGPEQEYISEVGLYVTPGSFKNCSSIQTIEVKNPTPPTGAEFSDAVYSKAHLTVPVESKSLYKEAIGWKDFVSLMKYKITYVVDDSIYFADTLLVGDTIILPATPIKEGYSFRGWSEVPKTMPDKDIIVTGAFTINSYKITYIVDGEIYTTDSVAYGTKIIAIEEPYKVGHTFNGWSKIPETMPANDITIVGAFKYAVTYMVNNEVYNTDSIVYGDKIVLIAEPTKEGYTFSGWSDIPETMPAEDITITGSFTPNTYTITYMVDEEIFAVDTIAYGDTIALIPEPTQEGYTFSGWCEVPETMPAEDIVVTGSFVRNTYTITYIVDEEFFATDSITYGDTIIPIAEPTKEGYTFSGWSDIPEIMPAEDIVIDGYLSVNYYEINYIVDNEPFATDSVAYGNTIILRDEPQKEDYEFSGWSEAPETMPAHDIEVYGNFIFTSVTDVQVDPKQSQKVVEDNQLFIILPNGKKYNIMGQEM